MLPGAHIQQESKPQHPGGEIATQTAGTLLSKECWLRTCRCLLLCALWAFSRSHT